MLFNRFFLVTNLDYIIAIQNEHSSFFMANDKNVAVLFYLTYLVLSAQCGP